MTELIKTDDTFMLLKKFTEALLVIVSNKVIKGASFCRVELDSEFLFAQGYRGLNIQEKKNTRRSFLVSEFRFLHLKNSCFALGTHFIKLCSKYVKKL